MKRNLRNNLIFSLLFVLLVLPMACNNREGTHEAHADTYTCPMHPTVLAEAPGVCPVCGMDLVRKARAGESADISEEVASLINSPNERVLSSIQTIRGQYKSMTVVIEARGVVTYDAKSLFTIAARIGGRLEKVYVKYPFQPVRKGQKIAELYSPELLTAQRELLFLLENDTDNEALIAASKHKLSLLGATREQINALIQRKAPLNTFSIYSPYDGYVISNSQDRVIEPGQLAAGMNSGMGDVTLPPTPATASTARASGDAILREGTYVSVGQPLFKVINTASLRVELNIPSAQAAGVKIGTSVLLDFGNGDMQRARIDFIQPFYNEGQQFLMLRTFIKNSEQLHVGHLVNARLNSSPVEGLWIPKEAVVDLGADKIIFIKERDLLSPKKIVTGITTADSIQVMKGLTSSDDIAANAQYLVDSESFVKTHK